MSNQSLSKVLGPGSKIQDFVGDFIIAFKLQYQKQNLYTFTWFILLLSVHMF